MQRSRTCAERRTRSSRQVDTKVPIEFGTFCFFGCSNAIGSDCHEPPKCPDRLGIGDRGRPRGRSSSASGKPDQSRQNRSAQRAAGGNRLPAGTLRRSKLYAIESSSRNRESRRPKTAGFSVGGPTGPVSCSASTHGGDIDAHCLEAGRKTQSFKNFTTTLPIFKYPLHVFHVIESIEKSAR